MSRSWSRMVSRLFRTPAAKPAVRRAPRLKVEQFEDRVVPATVITILDSGVGTLDGFLSPTDGTITVADDAGNLGSVSRAALEAVGPTIDIVITAETDIAFDDLTSPLSLQTATGANAFFIASAGSITFADQSDTVQTAGSQIAMQAAISASLGGLSSNGGRIQVVADDIDLQAAVNAGAGAVELRSVTAGRDIDLGTETGGSLSLTDAEIDRVTSGVTRIGSADTGNITVTATITPAGSGFLSLQSGGDISDTTGGLDVPNLAVRGATVTLDHADTDVTNLAGVTTGIGGDFTFTNKASGGALNIDTVDGVAGITTTTAVPGTTFITLTAGGAVTQTAGANVTGPQLSLLGTGPVTLTNTGNDVATIAAALTGGGNALTYRDADTLTIDTINSTTGISTADGAISVSTVNGTLTVQDTTAAIDVNAGSATVFLNAGSTGVADHALTLNAGAAVTGTGGITLQADNMDISAAVDGGANTVRLDTHETTTAIDLGGADGAATLGLLDAELDFVTAGTLIVGNVVNTGNITITAAVSPGGTSQLELETGDASVVNGGGTITETRLGLTAGAVIGAAGNPLDVSVINLEAFTTDGGIFIDNAGTTLTIGGVNATLDGVRTNQNSIAITNDNAITIAEGISIGGVTGSITVTTSSDSIIVNAAVSTNVPAGAGNITITAEDDVDVTAAITASGAGDITVQADSDDDLSGEFINSGAGTLTTAGGDITISASDYVVAASIDAGTGIVTLQQAGTNARGIALGTAGSGFLADFNDGGSGTSLDGFSATGLWHATIDEPGASLPGHTAPEFAYYGIDAQDDFDNGVANSGNLTSGPIVLTGPPTLSFASRLGCESATSFDLVQVRISTDGGTTFPTVIASKAGGQIPRSGAWTKLTFDLSAFSGQTINVRFHFDTVDEEVNDGLGWQVDDVSIGGLLPSLSLTDAELDFVGTSTALRIGRSDNIGNIRINEQISQNAYDTLHLITGGAISDGTAGEQTDLTVTNLALQAGTGIGGDDIDTAVTNLAAFNSTAGDIDVANTGALNLPVGGVDGGVGVTNNAAGGNISLSAASPINVDSAISDTGGGNITLTTSGFNGDITLNVNGSIAATGGSGNIILDSSGATSDGDIFVANGPNAVDISAAGTGNISLIARELVSILANAVVQSAGGNILVQSNVGVVDGTTDITVGAGASILTNGNITLDADPDGNCVGGALITTPTTTIAAGGDLTVKVATDIVLRSMSAGSDISIHSCQNIFDDGDDATIVSAGESITLDAFGVIGGTTPITTADVLSASTATPTANYRAAIDVAYGTTITVDQTGSLGNIQLRKVGSAFATSSLLGVNGLPDIVGGGNQLVLIGAAGLTVDNVFTLSGAVNANLFLATVNGFDVSIVGAGSAINNGASTTTTVIASGNTSASITGPAANNTANVTGFNVLLATSGGNIGAAGSPIEINSDAAGRFDGFTTGTVNGVASPGGDAFFTDTQNGIRVGLFNAGTGDVTLNSLGNITPAGSSIVAVTHNDNVAEIVGSVVSLNATGASTGSGGQIGLPAQFFEVNANNLNASTNDSNLWISEVGTLGTAGVQIQLVTAGTATAFLRVRNGGLMVSQGGDPGVADVVAATVNLSTVAGDPVNGGFGTNITLPLEIDATTLNSNLAGLSGNLFVRDLAGGLTVQRANTTAGDVGIETAGGNLVLGNASSTGSVVLATGGTATLVSTGSITSAAPGGVVDVTANSLSASGAAGVGTTGTPIESAVSSADLTGGTGGAFLHNTGGLTLNSSSASGDIRVRTIDTAATPTLVAPAESLTVPNGSTVSSTGGNVDLEAGDDLTLAAGSQVSAAAGTVTLTGDFNSADAGAGGTIDVSGGVTSANPAAVNGGPDNDTITIDVGANNNAFAVNGNAPVFPTFPGDTLDLDLTGVTTPVITPTGNGAGIYSFGNRPDVTFTSIENLVPGQTISGTIFLDINRNGVQDANEPGIAGLTVHLDRGANGTDDGTTFTDANGDYSFLDNTPGSYAISFDANPEFVVTKANPTVIAFSDATTGIDFGTYGRSIEVVAGPTAGTVIVRDAETGTTVRTFVAYPGYIGTVTTAVGDVNGDGYLDAITGAGPGGGPHVKAFSGRDGSLLATFFPYDMSFRGGVFVAAGDLNGDGLSEIIAGAGQDGGPHVTVFRAGNFLGQAAVQVASFFAYDASVRSGVHVGAGDVNGDDIADIITGARGGAGFAPHVKVFDPVMQSEIRSFFAYDASFTGGVFVAGGDLDGDGFAEIITGTETLVPHVKVFSGATGAEIRSFFAYDPSVPGVSVGTADKDNDGDFDILTGSRLGSHVKVFDGATLAELDSFLAFGTDLNGVFVGGA